MFWKKLRFITDKPLNTQEECIFRYNLMRTHKKIYGQEPFTILVLLTLGIKNYGTHIVLKCILTFTFRGLHRFQDWALKAVSAGSYESVVGVWVTMSLGTPWRRTYLTWDFKEVNCEKTKNKMSGSSRCRSKNKSGHVENSVFRLSKKNSHKMCYLIKIQIPQEVSAENELKLSSGIVEFNNANSAMEYK